MKEMVTFFEASTKSVPKAMSVKSGLNAGFHHSSHTKVG